MSDLWMILQLVVLCGALLHSAIVWVQAVRNGRTARRLPLTSYPTPATLPRVSVLVPAWREADALQATITALATVQYPAYCELIFIAGGPDDSYARTRQLVREHLGEQRAQVLEQPPAGKNAALTQGLAVASGDVIVVLDADTLVEANWLAQLVTPLCSDVTATCGNYFPLRHTWVSRQEQMEKLSRYEIHRQPILQGSGSIAIRRDVLTAIGGFPADVLVGVDWELDTRVSSSGAKKAFARDAHVHTQRPATLHEYWRNEVRWRRAHLGHLLRKSEWFFRSVRSSFQSSVYYLVALVPLACALGMVISALFGWENALRFGLNFSVIWVIWVFLHRAALVIEVATYTADVRWLASLWIPGVLLLVSITASWRAIATLNRQKAHFKGPRS